MRLYTCIALLAALALPALSQTSPPAPVAPLAPVAPEPFVMRDGDLSELRSPGDLSKAFDFAQSADLVNELDLKRFELDARMNAMTDKLTTMTDKLASKDFTYQMDKAAAFAQKFDMAFLQGPKSPVTPLAPVPPSATARTATIRNGRGDSEYNSGMRALDQHKYDEAVQRFDAVVDGKGSRSDGALYWKAYALNRGGKRDEALAAIAQLRRDYASSPWLNDAQALEAEVKANAGKPISPEQESNEDIKLMAINSLMNADAERAIPLVEGVLKGTSAPNIKDRALFVLSQNRSPRAQQALFEYAKGGTNPDLQARAINYVGMSNTREAQQQLSAIYASSSDPRVKNSVLEGLYMSRASEQLLAIARSEKDPALHTAAIRDLMMVKGVAPETMIELYSSADAQTKREIIGGFMGRNDGKTLVDLARKETDPAMKRIIVEHLSNMRNNKEALDYMVELLK